MHVRSHPLEWEETGYQDAKRHPSNWPDIFKARRDHVALEKTRRMQELQHEGFLAQQERNRLVRWLENAPPAIVLESGKEQGHIFLALGSILLAGNYLFFYIALQPWILGFVKAHLAAGTLAFAGIAATDWFLYAYVRQQWIHLTLSSIALMLFMYVGSLLGFVRAERFIEEITASANVEVISEGGATPAAPRPENEPSGFYARTGGLLKIIFALLPLALEPIAGLLFHEGRERAMSPFLRGWSRLDKLQHQLQQVHSELQTSQCLEDSFTASYLIGAKRAVGEAPEPRGSAEKETPDPQGLDKRVSAAILIAFLVLTVLVFLSVQLSAATPPVRNTDQKSDATRIVVVALDLSKSSEATGHDGTSAFQKNSVAIHHLIQTLEPCTDISIIGITDASFERPYVILQARIGCDPGFFGEKLKEAQQTLRNAWTRWCGVLKADCGQTDVIGAIFLAQDIFRTRSHAVCDLVFFSDMRHVARGLDLESPERLNVKALLETAKEKAWVPQLRDVHVLVFGVHAAGKDIAYWHELKAFWTEFFQISGATVNIFSTQREGI